MKKIVITLALLSIVFMNATVLAEEVDLAPTAGSAYLMDYETGTVMYEKNADEQLYPASMTKMMSLLLVMEQLHAGIISLEDEVVASSYAASMGGTQVFIEENEVLTIEELIKSTAIASANDAVVVLAEKVGGTVDNFVAMMNAKAKELGCINTNFMNPTGLHDDRHYSSAKDMALIAQALIKEGKEDILQYTSRYEDYIREDSEHKFWLVNTNKIIRNYDGMDGLKTGYTSQSMYCITVTAQRDNMRLISVVMNEPNKDDRTKNATALLDYGFATYRMVEDYPINSEIMDIKIEKGKPSYTTLQTMDDIYHLTKNKEEVSIVDETVTITQNKAPMNVGDVVGSLTLHYSDNSTNTVNLTVSEHILALDYIDIFFMVLKNTVFS